MFTRFAGWIFMIVTTLVVVGLSGAILFIMPAVEVDSTPGHMLILPLHEASAARVKLQFDMARGIFPHCDTLYDFPWVQILDPSVTPDTVPILCYVPEAQFEEA